MFSLIIKNVTKDLIQRFNKSNSDYIFNILGKGESFLQTICLLPLWFNESFEKKGAISKKDLRLLSQANLKAWIGYTLYDYLRDGKIKKDKIVTAISIANICTQEALLIFNSYAKSSLASEYLLKLFNKVDLYYIRLENRKYLDLKENISFKQACEESSDKSIAACISTLLVLPITSEDKISYRHVIDFFKNYFTARQLSDDLDDYKKDIKLRILTPAVLLLHQGYSTENMRSLMRKEIDKRLIRAKVSLSKIESFDDKLFIQKYVKPC